MAKIIKYNLCTLVNHGTEEEPKIEEILSPITMGWNEVNEETAKREAYEGKYDIEDVEEPETPPTDAERIAELEEALDMLLNGVTE